MWEPLSHGSPEAERRRRHEEVARSLASLLDDEPDWIAAMATVACELHHAFAAWHWTGFYRATPERVLVIGPYQGGHGCLRIAYERGVCGAAARTGRTQLVDDVGAFPGHIACSGTTASEIVVPVHAPDGRLLAVLDVDSDLPAAFDALDRDALERLCAWLGERYAAAP